MTSPVAPRPSASVIIVRDGQQNLEVLLVQRNARIVFHGGSWVFPGGAIEATDHDASEDDPDIAAAKSAAIREAAEEVAINLRHDTLRMLSHWTTPEVRPKRFSTWFFVSVIASDSVVQVDGSEIVAHRWYAIADALAHRDQGKIRLPAPTYISLLQLQHLRNAEEVAAHFSRHRPPVFTPRIVALDEGECALYEGDAAYDSLDLHGPGQRHRLWMRPGPWVYEQPAPPNGPERK